MWVCFTCSHNPNAHCVRTRRSCQSDWRNKYPLSDCDLDCLTSTRSLALLVYVRKTFNSYEKLQDNPFVSASERSFRRHFYISYIPVWLGDDSWWGQTMISIIEHVCGVSFFRRRARAVSGRNFRVGDLPEGLRLGIVFFCHPELNFPRIE